MIKVFSGLMLIVGLTVAVGQEPPRKEEKPQQQKAPPKPPTDELEAAIASASANHPDVRMAQAKLQMAQAELDQAKLLVAQRLATARAKLLSAQAEVENVTQLYQHVSRLSAQRGVPKSELQAHEHKLAQAKASLAAAEAEWQAARGQAPGRATAAKDPTAARLGAFHDVYAAELQQRHLYALNSQLLTAQKASPAPGSAADKLRELVGKRVALDMKEPVVFEKALAEFVKQAGLGDLTVRSPEWANERFLKNPPKVGPLVGEQTVTGWLQLILDDFNRSLVTVGTPPEYQGKHEAYVRDYGLLITKTDLAPPGAPTLAEFARQAQKDAAPKPEPKK